MKEWTIMVYMAGDNNLNDDMIRAINELHEIIKNTGDELSASGSIKDKSNVGILVEFDGEHPLREPLRYDLTYTDPRTYDANSVGKPAPSPTPATSSIQEPLIKTSVEKFIDYCITTQPAKKYCLIFSGHSDAFQGKTLMIDENPAGILTLKEIHDVLKKFVDEKLNDKFQILGFDGCVMNTIEVMYEFKDVAETWIGSQGSIPNFTWDYKKIAQKLMTETAASLTREKILNTIIECVGDFNSEYSFGGRSVDISTAKLYAPEFEEASEQINNGAAFLFVLLGFYLRPDSLAFNHLLRIILSAHWNCQSYMRNQSIDLIDFAGRLSQECRKSVRETFANSDVLNDIKISCEPFTVDEMEKIENISGETKLSAEAQELVSLLHIISIYCDNLVLKLKTVFHGCFTGADYQFSNGGSLFMPWSLLGYKMSLAKYRELEFSGKPGWILFIALYVRLTARPKQTIDFLELLRETLKDKLPSTLEKFILENNLVLFSDTFKSESFSKSSTENNKFIAEKFDVEVIRKILVTILGEGGVKDNPNRSRGLDAYLYYFERTNNFFPDLTGDKKGCFPTAVSSKDC